jgi:hypothetical protein
MSTVRLLLHVMLAGVYVFLTSVTLLFQLASSNVTLTGTGVLTLVGAWAGASSTLRTKESLYLAAGGVALLLLLALRGTAFNFYVNVWILLVMVPLSICVWAVVAWRRWSDEHEGDVQTWRPIH